MNNIKIYTFLIFFVFGFYLESYSQVSNWNETLLKDSIFPALMSNIKADNQEEAMLMMDNIARYIEEKKDTIRLVDFLYKAGQTGQNFQKYNYAINKYTRGLKLIDKKQEKEKYLGSHYRRSFCLLMSEEYQAAEEGFNFLLEELNTPLLTDHWYEVNSHGALGSAYRWQAEFKSAISSYERAITLDEEYGTNQKGEFLKNLANVYTDLRQFEKSIEVLIRALNFFNENENESGSAYCRVSIASLLIKSGNYEEAYPRLKAEIPAMLELKNYNRLSLIYSQISDYHHKNENYLDEKTALDKAYECALKSKKLYHKAFVQKKLGTYYLFKQNFQKTEDLFNKALANFQTIEDYDGISSAYLGLGKNYYKKGQYSLATKNLKDCLKIAHKNAFINYLKSAYEILSLIEQEKENNSPKLALHYQSLYLKFSDSLEILESPIEITNAVSDYERKRQDSIIDSTKNENTLLNQRRKLELLIFVLIIIAGAIILFVLINKNKKEQKRKQQLLEKSWQELKDAQAILMKSKFFTGDKTLSNSKDYITVQTLLEEIQSTKSRIDNFNKHNQESQKELTHKIEHVKTELYTITHDLKLPISTLKKEIKDLPKTPNISNQEKLLEFVNYIETLLQHSLSSLRLDEYSLRPQLFSSMEVLEDLLHLTDLGKMQVEKGKMPEIYADPLLIRQVFQNIIDNSIKFTKNKPKPTLYISTKHHEMGVEFIFEDNGIGLTPDMPVFSLFSSSNNSQEDISGIGLYIVKKIVEKHGSVIQASPSSYGGLKVSFILPTNPIN